MEGGKEGETETETDRRADTIGPIHTHDNDKTFLSYIIYVIRGLNYLYLVKAIVLE